MPTQSKAAPFNKGYSALDFETKIVATLHAFAFIMSWEMNCEYDDFAEIRANDAFSEDAGVNIFSVREQSPSLKRRLISNCFWLNFWCCFVLININI